MASKFSVMADAVVGQSTTVPIEEIVRREVRKELKDTNESIEELKSLFLSHFNGSTNSK